MKKKTKFEFFLFISFVKLFRLIGLSGTRKAALYLGYLLYYLIPVRKKIVISNLKTAVPDKTEKEIRKLALKTYQNILITFFELMTLPSLKREEVESSIKISNLEEIKKRIGINDAAILLTGHFGGWEFCISALSVKIGRVCSELAQPQSNALVSDYVMKARAKFGNNIVLSGVSVRKLYETIKNGGLVTVAGDQRGPFEGPRFNFFGKPTSLYTGTASIALKMNCPIVLVACERQKDFSYIMHLEELNLENLPEDTDGKIREMTQRYISFLEKYIRINPDQYFWMHKIWKY